MRILLLDNHDSFTWNLWQQIRSLGCECDVRTNDDISLEDIRKERFDRIVISPGPGSPRDAGISCDVIRAFGERTPILGVCLGHQCIAKVFGGENAVTHAPLVMHGKTSPIHHEGKSIFKGLPSPFQAARYHSLLVSELPPECELLAWTPRDPGSRLRDQHGGQKLIMAMKHRTHPIVGVQFHPESFLTEHGDELMRHFLFARW